VGLPLAFPRLLDRLQRPGQEAGKAGEDRPPPAGGLTAEGLYQQFADNPIAAGRRHTGKVREVTGRVRAIGNAGAVVLYPAVVCQFYERQLHEVARLRPGQQVTVRGHCGDLLGPRGLRFDDCEVVK
jgi:hypothetical protein